ncbi:GNAT family N-acetyltransferase [Streptomyces yangpuensis]|uniref:GNAT family N-acetyltransferase n=1 Tax=Streptomyces yangpuensis TaxID=1648182 RepID=A0ABY5Q689_9ACTN|nr:GNAT family N-acetyltransferase [Streptomyces yangpuensis]MBZ9599951.1 GNAT family N-acetyltransferase [Streptomyces erythrochromogenes]UUY51508.1 GNAT family N-acetyltransferase [Streptomyces yangpuensis]
MVKVRAARAAEAEALTGLVMRSKAHWGYDAGFLAACAAELRIRPDEVTARRIVVAEDPQHGVLGVASLEGAAPLATLGLLFVEPAAIGQGVGRLLYREVLRRAVEQGVRRLVIDADPHAAGFYRAMGAVPVPAAGRDATPGPAGTVAGGGPASTKPGWPGALVRFEVAPAPLADWARAWTGGGRAVHVGNVAEFNVQFADSSLDREQSAAHHYSCLAAFYSPLPSALVLPRAVPAGWTDLVGRQLGWTGVEVYDGLVERGPGLADAVRARPALAARLTGAGEPLVPWGLTRPFALLTGRPWRPGELRHESKAAAHGLFERILADGGHPGIVLPSQVRAATRWAAARLLTARARAGKSTVVKSEHGVGGSGTTVVTAGQVRAAGGARAVLRRLPRGPLLVEEFVEGPTDPGAARDLTYDGFVDPAGRVHEVGAALMDVTEGAYRGATVGPGAVPERAEKPLLAFGAAVGRELASSGYRGWFDVDFVVDAEGRLAPTETNLRLTGPAIAFMVAARLDALRGAGHLVRIADRVELGARLPEAQVDELCADLARACGEIGAVFVPAIPTGAFDPAPWLGVLVAAHSPETLDAAEALVRSGAAAVGALFDAAPAAAR